MNQPRSSLLADLAKGDRCVQCGLSVDWMLEVDHVIPLADGGPDTLENLQTLCWFCHGEKTRRENARRNLPPVFRIGY